MADVVRIQERLSRMPPRAKVWHEAPAAVLFFTGVRIERHGEGDQASRPQRRGSTGGKRRGKA